MFSRCDTHLKLDGIGTTCRRAIVATCATQGGPRGGCEGGCDAEMAEMAWFSMVFHGFPWFSMVFHGFPTEKLAEKLADAG